MERVKHSYNLGGIGVSKTWKASEFERTVLGFGANLGFESNEKGQKTTKFRLSARLRRDKRWLGYGFGLKFGSPVYRDDAWGSDMPSPTGDPNPVQDYKRSVVMSWEGRVGPYDILYFETNINNNEGLIIPNYQLGLGSGFGSMSGPALQIGYNKGDHLDWSPYVRAQFPLGAFMIEPTFSSVKTEMYQTGTDTRWVQSWSGGGRSSNTALPNKTEMQFIQYSLKVHYRLGWKPWDKPEKRLRSPRNTQKLKAHKESRFHYWLTTKSEREVKGNLEETKDSSFSFSTMHWSDGRRIFTTQDIPVAQIQDLQVRRKGSIGAGAIIGAALGVIAGASIGSATANNEGFLSPLANGIAGGVLGTLIGTGVGASIGSARKRIPINGSQASYVKERGKLKRFLE